MLTAMASTVKPRSRFEQSLDAAQLRCTARPADIAAHFRVVELLLLCGRNSSARERLREIESRAAGNVAVLARVSAIYTQAMAHTEALRCCELALAHSPNDCTLIANLAAAETACGHLEAADARLGDLLEINPHDGPTYYNRAILKRRTQADNHVDAIRSTLRLRGLKASDEVPLRYALAKELEDLGEYGESFQHLALGAAARRASLTYQVAGDEQAIAAIGTVFNAGLLSQASKRREAVDGVAAPLFIMGLPRSGTTLTDRILSSHSRVDSLGEINDFSLALVRAGGEHADKMQLIERSACLDFETLGSDYLRSIQTYDRAGSWLIDKTPRNYLYLGLIALALPTATAIHMCRDPLDTCYALYKTLFGAGSPYSYDLNDLGRYYIAYHGLMMHWRQTLSERFLDISYEHLVSDQESVTREMLRYTRLSWEPACLDFHRNPLPAATASAAQVREPIHARSIGMWKHYECELAPLARLLAAANII